mgnify:CR=1 FL=1
MFKVIKKEGKARRGVFTCAHGGEVQTPVFMNVGTQAAIKGGVSAIDLKERLGTQIELSNTYHLHLRPGDDVVRLFRPQLERLSHEECWVVYLTSSNRVIERYRISQGGVTGTVVDHRLIVKRALELLATQLILVHNHPSGTPEASAQDKALTERVARAAALFDIRLLDHIIIARDGDFSFLREGLMGR